MVGMATWEFTSEHSSSYDVDGLIVKLNVRAAAGWEVVAIIPTGGDVTAFFKREAEDEADGEASAKAKEDDQHDKAKEDKAKEAAPVAGGLGSLAAGTSSTSHDSTSHDAATTDQKETDKTPSPVAAAPAPDVAPLSMSERLDAIRDSVAASPASTSTPDPIKEPSGWAVSPETSSSSTSSTPAS
ncbi:MAG: hypothetical protein QOD72_3958, partial [Acidimicrobiaceae bacterium]|nr:hypothetical protein [Acidimicrobiaceae bacterium]